MKGWTTMGLFGVSKGSNMKESYENLEIGMTKDEVLSMLGDPDSVKKRGESLVLTWWNREFKGFLRGGTIERRIIVEFENDIVTGYDGENMDASAW